MDATATIEVTPAALKDKRVYLRYRVIDDVDTLVGAEVSAPKSKTELSIDSENFFEPVGVSQLAGIFNGRASAKLTFDSVGTLVSIE